MVFKRAAMRKKIILTLTILSFLLAGSAVFALLPAYLTTSTVQVFASSYNPAPNNNYQAPISSTGLSGLNHPMPAQAVDLSKLNTGKPGFAPNAAASKGVQN